MADKTPYDLICEQILYPILVTEHGERLRKEITKLFASELGVPPETLSVAAQCVSALADSFTDNKTLPEVAINNPIPIYEIVSGSGETIGVATFKSRMCAEISRVIGCDVEKAKAIFAWLIAIARAYPLIFPGYHAECIEGKHLLLHKAERSYNIEFPVPLTTKF